MDVLCAVSHTVAYLTSWSIVTDLIFFIVKCGIVHFLCAMRVFHVMASSLPKVHWAQIHCFCSATFVPHFVSVATSVAKLAHGEQLHTQSLTHSTSSFDAPGTEAFTSEHDQMHYHAAFRKS